MKREANSKKSLKEENPKKDKSTISATVVRTAPKTAKPLVRVETDIKPAETVKKTKGAKLLEKVVVSIKPVAGAKKAAPPVVGKTVERKQKSAAVVIKPETKKTARKPAAGRLKETVVITPKADPPRKIKSRAKATEKTVQPKALKKALSAAPVSNKTSKGEKPPIERKANVSALKTASAPKAAPPKKVNAKQSVEALPNVASESKPSLPKPVKKKAKPISSAVLRGKTGRYDFEVFPLDTEFEKTPAIYVISKRVTDKQRRGHHKLICIGQTESILDDIKKHKKDKCIKENKANVVCLLKEQDEANRQKIATDLRAAHMIVCHHK